MASYNECTYLSLILSIKVSIIYLDNPHFMEVSILSFVLTNKLKLVLCVYFFSKSSHFGEITIFKEQWGLDLLFTLCLILWITPISFQLVFQNKPNSLVFLDPHIFPVTKNINHFWMDAFSLSPSRSNGPGLS